MTDDLGTERKGRFDQGLDQFLAEIELAQFADALREGGEAPPSNEPLTLHLHRHSSS